MHGIRVGDNLTKVKDAFKYENVSSNESNCEVIFDGSEEMSSRENSEDDWIAVYYLADENGIITTISISDERFAMNPGGD